MKNKAKKKTKDISKPSISKKTNYIYLLLFFFSGFVGLCYQVVWIRELSVIFGKTNAAISVVVSVFMLGLGLGSIYWGRRAIPHGKLSRTFSFLQLGIAGGSTLLLIIFPYLSQIYKALVNPSNLTEPLILILVFLICALLMFIPTFLMGGTFPVISQLFIRDNSRLGKGIGILYGVNTAGGILGAALTGYFLVGLMGQDETHLIGIILNILIGISFYFMKDGEQLPEEPKKEKQADILPDENPKMSRYFLVAAFLTGFAGLGYEILWSRAIATFTSNSVYSFSSILVVYLAGIGLGSFIYTRFLSNYTKPFSLLIFLQFVLFLSVAVTAIFLNDIPAFIVPFRGLLTYPLMSIIFPGLFLSFLLMFIPTFVMGISFPLLSGLYARSIIHLRGRLGKIFFVNTLGSMAGPMIAGFILIPVLGVIKGLVATALINLFIALYGTLFLEEAGLRKKQAIVMGGMAVLVILAPFLLGKSSYILPPSVLRNIQNPQEIKYYNETAEGTVCVVEDMNTEIRSCYVNNSAVCGTTYDALKVVHYMGHLPFFIHPEARTALVIGFGIGVTTSAIAQHPLDKIDCVEICPGVKESAPFFEDFNAGVWKNPKLNYIGGDGRNYLLVTREMYDIISCDPVHPTLGSGSLYTKEYFELCKNHLNPGGIISQYLPFHKLTLNDLKTLLNTFYTVFPDSMVWIAQTHGVLIGSNRELRLSFSDILSGIQRIDDPFFKDPYLLASTLVLDKNGIKSFVADHKGIDTDNRSMLEYFSVGSTQVQHHFDNIAELLRVRQHPAQMIYDVPDPYLLDLYVKGQLIFTQGVLAYSQGEGMRARKLFLQALNINPQNQEIRLFLSMKN